MPSNSLRISTPIGPAHRAGLQHFRRLAAAGTRVVCGRVVTAILATALAILAAACASDIADVTSPQDVGSFSAAVSDATTGSIFLNGRARMVALAVSDTTQDSPPEGIVLFLQDRATSAQIGFEWFGTPILTTQTYRIGAAHTDVALGYIAADGSVFNGTAGSIVISSVTNGVVVGGFSGTAVAADTSGQTVSISGTFKARITSQ